MNIIHILKNILILLVWSAAIFMLGCCILSAGFGWPIEIVFNLLGGWAFFLPRVFSSFTIGWSETITSLLCLVGLTVGTQIFLGWLYRSGGNQQMDMVRRHWLLSWTLAGLSIVVLTFLAGIATVGVFHQVAWLLHSPEPLVHDRNRFYTDRAHSQNNLHHMGIAAHNYLGVNDGRLPALSLDDRGTLMHSWQTHLLPFLEADRVYRQIKLDQPWNHPAQGKTFQESIAVYLQPRVEPKQVDGFAASHYAGNVHLFGQEKPQPFEKMVANLGMSNVILAGEVKEGFRPWGDPRNLRDPAAGLNRSATTFGGSDPRGVTQVLMGDGSVRSFSGDTDPDFLELLGKPQP